MPELGIDVTIPIQALVSKGQLYVPGGRSKVRKRFLHSPIVSHTFMICFCKFAFGLMIENSLSGIIEYAARILRPVTGV